MPVSNFSIAVLMGHGEDDGLREEDGTKVGELNQEDVSRTSTQGKSHSLEKTIVLTNKTGEGNTKGKDLNGSNDATLQRKRTSFSRLQQRMLEAKFQRAPYLTIQERNNLASFLQLNSRQVKVWFQNRRNKWKRENKGQFLIQPALEVKSYGPFNPAGVEKCFPCAMYNPYSHVYFASTGNRR